MFLGNTHTCFLDVPRCSRHTADVTGTRPLAEVGRLVAERRTERELDQIGLARAPLRPGQAVHPPPVRTLVRRVSTEVTEGSPRGIGRQFPDNSPVFRGHIRKFAELSGTCQEVTGNY